MPLGLGTHWAPVGKAGGQAGRTEAGGSGDRVLARLHQVSALRGA